MAITYSYKIDQLRKVDSLNGLSDVIVHVRFTYTGEDEDGNTGEFKGAIPMPEPTEGEFTELAELTEEEVIEWVKVHHPTGHMQHMIAQQIKDKKAIESDVDLPWAPPTTTTTTTTNQDSPTE